MNQIKLLFTVVIIFIFISCQKQEPPIKTNIDGNELKSLIESSLKADHLEKNKLKGLFTYIADDFDSYNKIEIDSIQIDSIKFFSIIIENRIPVYNLFAIVDEKLKLYLKDESLNGFLESNWRKSGSNIYTVVNENFRSNNVIELSRTSLYSFNDHAFDLVYRQFEKLKSPEKIYEQNITLLSDTTIYTEITDIKARVKKIGKDIFRFDPVKNKYSSTQNVFTNLVQREVAGYQSDSTINQITDYESIKSLLGLEPDTSSTNNSDVLSDDDFEIKLNTQWKRITNYTITNYINKEKKGIKFINTRIGASLSIFKTPPQDSAKNYFDQPLANISNDRRFKFSNEYEIGKSVFKVFEFSCLTKKIYVLLEAPKATYENNIEIFNAMINSIKVNC